MLKAGCRWRDAAPEYDLPISVYNRYILHGVELATVLLLEGSSVRPGAVVPTAADFIAHP
jgi:hypothetical protein